MAVSPLLTSLVKLRTPNHFSNAHFKRCRFYCCALTAVTFAISPLSAEKTRELSLSTNSPLGESSKPPASQENRTNPPPAEVELRGQLICVPEEMHRLYQSELPTNHQHLYGFKVKGGGIYTLLRVKMSEALFADPALAGKELLINGRLFPGTQIFEPTRLRSIKNEKVYDLYYYCAICEIEGVEPGECMCCRAPVELVEKEMADLR